MRRRAMAVTGCAMAVLAAAPAVAQQIIREPRVIRLDLLTCGELLAITADERDRVLIFYNGYLAGTRGLTTWDERVQGAIIERAVKHCRQNPGDRVLSTFTTAAP